MGTAGATHYADGCGKKAGDVAGFSGQVGEWSRTASVEDGDRDCREGQGVRRMVIDRQGSDDALHARRKRYQSFIGSLEATESGEPTARAADSYQRADRIKCVGGLSIRPRTRTTRSNCYPRPECCVFSATKNRSLINCYFLNTPACIRFCIPIGIEEHYILFPQLRTKGILRIDMSNYADY